MKLRSFFYLLATIVIGLFLTGTIAFFWLFAQSPLWLLNGSRDEPSAVMFISKQAPVMASLMVNPDRLTGLRQVIAKPGERKQARAELDQVKQGIVGGIGLDYQRDLQPWLGDEITLAVTSLDLDRDSENGQQPGYLMALTTKDPQRSREFLQVFWQKRASAGTNLIFESYKGTKLIYGRELKDGQAKNLNSSSFASAVVGNQFVLFANSPKVLRDAINTVQAEELGLENSANYQAAIANLTQRRIGIVFFNLPQLAALTGEESALAKLTSSEESATYQRLAIALGLDRRGLTAETALLSSTGDASTPPTSKPLGALNYVPASSPLSASGVNLDRAWANLSQGVSGYRGVADLVNRPVEALNDRWKLDLPQDIFSWVKGEYAFGLVPRGDEGTEEKTVTDWVFVADKSADQSSQSAIEHLDDLAKQQGISIGSLQLSDQTVNVWTRLLTVGDAKKRSRKTVDVQAQVAGVHASVGNYEIFTTSVEAMDDVLKATKHPISKTKGFEEAIAPLSTPNNGYLYLSWKTAQPILEIQFPVLKVVKFAGQPLFDHLRSLTISSYGSQPGVQRGGAFLKLG